MNPKTFLGDAAFDTIEIYKTLFDDLGFQKAFIPLRVKLSMEENGYTFNEDGIPCCPHDPTLPMKREGSKTQNEKTLHADLLLAGITQLVTAIVADKIHQHQYLRSLKPLIA